MESTVEELESAIAELRRRIAEYQSYIEALEARLKERLAAQQK